MDAYSSTDRLSRTLVAAVVLGGLCFGYMSVSSRWLDVPRSPRRHRNQVAPAAMNSVADDSVWKWCAEDAWVQQAKMSFKDGSRYLFCDKVEQSEMASSGPSGAPRPAIEVSPIAIVWMDEDPHVAPIIATADSARLILSKPFSPQDFSAGHIVSARLARNVVIQGPKGLHITGNDFNMTEESMKMTSRKLVNFHWDGHSGYAEGGVEIALDRDSGNGKGLTSVGDIQLVTLNGPVHCDLNFLQRRNQDLTHLEIDAPARFEFDLTTNVGTFFGKLGKGKSHQNDVLVKRSTAGTPDRLYCPQLVVEFHPEIVPDTGKAKEGRFRLGKVSARGMSGRIVVYQSDENDIKAGMMQLDYLVGARQLDMFGSLQTGGNAAEKPLRIAIQQNGRSMRVAHLRVLHGAQNEIERVECRGRGFIRDIGSTRDKTTEDDRDQGIASFIEWQRQLNVQRGADGVTHTVSIEGGGDISLPENQMRLAGRTIKMTLDTTSTANDSAAAGGAEDLSLSMSDVVPKKLIARGDVILRSPQASGELKEQLTVYFEPHENSSNNSVSVISRSREVIPSDKGSVGQADVTGQGNQEYSQFFGREMTVHVVLPEDSDGKQKWSSVRLAGDVTVKHHGADPQRQYTAEGSTFIAQNGLGDLAEINLLGNPAVLQSPTGHLKGSRIDLHQAESVAEIPGGGELKMVIDQDFDGTQLPSPVPMKVYWTDRMEVRGRKAQFIGGIRVEFDGVQYAADDEQIHNTELKTPELEVFFVEPIDLTGSQSSGNVVSAAGHTSGSPEVERIQCVGQTMIHQESFTAGQLDGLQDMEVVDLRIEPGTGEFSAIGPGSIESTRTNSSSNPGKSRLQPVTQIRVRVNEPTTEIRESPFARIKVTFIGEISGNLKDREVRLLNFVNIAFAPVQDLDEEIDLESIPAEEMPEESRLLQAEEVHIEAIPGSEENGFSITALGNARLESRDLSGDADRMTYDHSKSQIIMTAEKGRFVNGRHRPGGAGQLRTFKGPYFEYNLKTREPKTRNFILDSTN
jgi:hypothetical protein